jgi:diacylglycerol kinase (ATP)
VTRVLLVFNPTSGGADEDVQEAVHGALASMGEVSVSAPEEGSFADDLRSAAEGVDVLVVGGGDGTLNHTVNALEDRFPALVLGLVPMGTGNDFARTLGSPEEPLEAAKALLSATPRGFDLGRASGGGVERLFLNACMGGFPVQVDEAIDEKVKKRLGPVAFWIGGAKALGDLTPSTVTINGRELEGCVAAGVGNGRTCGGGVKVWPSALPDDGALDACALAVLNPAQGALLAARVRSGSHEGLDGVLTSRAATIEIECDPAFEFNVDGELVDLTSPARFELAGRVRFLVPG